MTYLTNKEIEGEFDKEFFKDLVDFKYETRGGKLVWGALDFSNKQIKFITTLRKKDLEAILEMVKGMKEEWVIKSSGTGKIDGRAVAFINKVDLSEKLKNLME